MLHKTMIKYKQIDMKLVDNQETISTGQLLNHCDILVGLCEDVNILSSLREGLSI